METETGVNKNKWLFSKPLVILISGRAGVGKSTFARLLKSEFEKKELGIGISINSLALGVKASALNYFGWDKKKDVKGRKLLQSIGYIGREYDEDVWVQFLLSHLGYIYFPNIIIIDDWRFPNERKFFEIRNDKYNLFTIRIEVLNREILKGTEEYSDISETSLPSSINTDYFDLIIINTKDMDFLKVSAKLTTKDIVDMESKKEIKR